MLGLVLLAGVSASSDADAANAAYTQCLFAVSRDASAVHLSTGAFEEMLEHSCASEQAALQRATARIFRSRGEADASSRAKRLADDGRKMVVNSYRKTRELEPQLKELAALCKAHPEQCRD
jgi:hypothetical protein